MDQGSVDAGDACSYFEHVMEYQVAVCRECRHGVLPSHIERHLQHVHKVEHKEAERVAKAARGWVLAEYASEVQVPSQIVQSITQLPVFADGLLCRLGPDRCSKIFRSAEVMRKHLQKTHD
jgi:hypothetical protein